MSREDTSCDWFHGALSREDAQKILIDGKISRIEKIRKL